MQLQNWLRIIVSKKVFSYLLKHRVGSRTLIYGAGITGQQLVEQMVLNSQFYNPIGFLDDDMSKSSFVYMRISVIGNINDLQKVVKENQVKFLIVAISKIQASKLVHLEQKCKEIGVSMRVIPSPLEILKTNLNLEDILNFSAEDILGRPQIEYNKKEIFDFLQGKRVLITGAGGSIGSELARQINQVNTEELLLLDRDETALLNLNLSLKNDGLFKDDNIILGDIRDSKMISDLIEKRKPEIVFHVAALKHLALVEKYPEEAHKTNVIATQNLIKACLDFNVRYFVNISSDKAVDPINVLGKTKLDIERVIATISSPDKIYISVRFGNVIGSNGSFLNTFGQQIKNGGPITITHPEVTRYFMSVSDAVFLVLQSLLVGKCGETLILDMGDPIKIDDIAKKMVSDSGKNIDIIYTGLRIGEKLHEKLIGEHEVVNLTKNPYIKSTNVVNEAEA
jgi:FlaA1/EpsC-like NDP-sugar epimerase